MNTDSALSEKEVEPLLLRFHSSLHSYLDERLVFTQIERWRCRVEVRERPAVHVLPKGLPETSTGRRRRLHFFVIVVVVVTVALAFLSVFLVIGDATTAQEAILQGREVFGKILRNALEVGP